MFKKLSLLVISLSTCVSLASTKLIHDSDLLNAKIYQLENGLKVYLTKNTQSPTFYAEIAVRCGSIHDPANATGMAHYLEHLMFKGSQKLGTSDFEKEEPLLNQITELYDEHSKTTDPEKRKEIYAKINDLSQQSAKLAIANEMDRLYQSLGGSGVNAHTSLEETVYKVNLPSNRIEQWAMIEAERFNKPIFRLFHTELETVYEEKNQNFDSGDSRNWNQLLSQIYPNHPYGETVLGKPEHLKNPSISALYKHYNTYYVPNNMAILISGDIDFEKTLGLIEKHFGSWEAGKGEIPQPAKPINKLNGVKRSEIFFEGEEYITMAFPTVPFDHPDIEALYMFDMLMDNSVVGLINLNLVQAQKVRSAGSYPYALHHAGTQHFYAYPREGQSLEELEKLILEQVNLVKEGKFDEGILDAIITDLRLDEETSYEDNASRVAAMRDSFLSGKSWNYDLQYFPRLEKVTKDDIIRAAKKYFTDSYVVVHKKNGKADIESIEKPKIDPIEMNASAQSDFAKQILEIKNEPLQPQFLKENEHYLKSSKNGIDFVTVENPVNNVFSLTWHFKTGKLTDNRLDLALSSLDLSGTESATASELKNKWYRLGATLSMNTQESYSYISLSAPEYSYHEAVSLFYDYIENFKCEQSVLDNLITDIKVNKKDQRDDSQSILHALARYARYGENSVYRKELSDKQLDEINPEDIKSIITTLFNQKHTVSYAGKKSPSVWQQSIKIPSELSPSTKLEKRDLRSKDSDGVEILFIHRETAQSLVWLESNAGEYGMEEDYAPVELFNEYFSGGMSSIVVQELREARGLAYSAYAFSSYPRWKDDAFLNIGRISCQADKTIEAVTTFLDLFEQTPDSVERFEASKNSILGQFRSFRQPFRNIPSILTGLERKGYETTPSPSYYKIATNSTIETIKKFHTDHVKGKKMTVCIVGDKTKIDMEALKKVGKLEELTIEDIYSF